MSAILGKLKKRPQFLKVSVSGKRWVTPGFILQMHVRETVENDPNTIENIRIGYLVSKKVGCAVDRNRVKRRLQAAVAKVFSSCAQPGRDYILIGRRNAYNRPFKSLLSDMKWAIKNLDARHDIPKNSIKDRH